MSEILDDHFAGASQMPDGHFEFYRDFILASQVEEFVQLLREHGIPYLLENSKPLLDKTIGGQGLTPFAVVKIRLPDFPKVGQLLAQQVEDNPSLLEQHYFQQFSAVELVDVLKHPDEWTPEDVAAARLLLKSRGVEVPKSQLAVFQETRKIALRQGKKADKRKLAIYSVGIALGGLFIGPLFFLWGLGLGWYYWKDKTTDNLGTSYHTFDTATRNIGRLIYLGSWIGGFLCVLLRIRLGFKGHYILHNFNI